MLEIEKHKREILFLIHKYQIVIVHGSSGCGKSTKIPQFLVDAGYSSNTKTIAVTQPTKLAAINLAKWSSWELDGESTLGKSVDVSFNYRDKLVANKLPKLQFLTDYALFEEIIFNPLLDNYSSIMIDDVHVRTVYIDLLLFLLKRILEKRSELRLIICSSVLHSRTFVEYFGKKTFVYQIQQIGYPIKIYHLKNRPINYLKSAFLTITNLHRTKADGDILVFLPGKDDIEQIYEMIHIEISTLSNKNCLQMYPLKLHASLSTTDQEAVFVPAPLGTRKVILATSIAENALTIKGVVYVIDSGLEKVRFYDPTSGIEHIFTLYQSHSSAAQRAARVGRIAEGEVYRLFSQNMLQREMKREPIPQILRTDLTNILFQLKSLGIDKIVNSDFITAPYVQSLVKGFGNLFQLGAIDKSGDLTTNLGIILRELPLEPIYGAMLINSPKFNCTSEILSIVAMLTFDGIFVPTATDFQRLSYAVEEGDHITMLNIYNAFIESRMSLSWCHKNGINSDILNKIVAFRSLLVKYLEHFRISIQSCSNPIQILKCIASVMPQSNVATLDNGIEGSYRIIGSGNKRISGLFIHSSSCLFKRRPECILFQKIVSTSKSFMLLCSIVDSEWISQKMIH